MDVKTGADAQRTLINGLKASLSRPGTRETLLVETHISFVLLTGSVAYKIKKAITLPFLDFTTLEARRFDCEEEVRLNRRLASDLYIGVMPITGATEAPRIGGNGRPLEYAVVMREFDQDQLLSRLVARQRLTSAHIDQLAEVVASFHGKAAVAAPASPFGDPVAALAPALENFDEMFQAVTAPGDRQRLADLRAWTLRVHQRLLPLFERRRAGAIRECHGDLHLNNIALLDDRVTLFDCLEFNESMRWIDVMSDVAFLVMDLRESGRADLAARFLNRYLELTGDYEGVGVLPFYIVYRALVRAKIASVRLQQAKTEGPRNDLVAEFRQYLDLAARHGRNQPMIIITHGLAGSGKTTIAGRLVDRLGAIRIRTDLERKRLNQLEPLAETRAGVNQGLYTDAETRRVYNRVEAAAQDVAAAGFTAIVDATFLKRWQRDLLRAAAQAVGVPFRILTCAAPTNVLEARIEARARSRSDSSDATIAVLAAQQQTQEPLGADERSVVIADDDAELQGLAEAVQGRR